jgi:hypothetical protein
MGDDHGPVQMYWLQGVHDRLQDGELGADRQLVGRQSGEHAWHVPEHQEDVRTADAKGYDASLSGKCRGKGG